MKKLSEKNLFQGRWISVREVRFMNSRQQEVAWEMIARNRQKSSVIVIPILMPSRRVVLIKQYRLPLEDWIIGFPAGMTDGNPDQAFKELKEETGYTGVIVEESPTLQINSGLLNETTKIIVMHIDEHDPANQDPCQPQVSSGTNLDEIGTCQFPPYVSRGKLTQALEPTEEIEVMLVPCQQVRSFLLDQSRQGVRIAAGAWSAFGIQLHLG